MLRRALGTAILAVLALSGRPAQALQIVIDYSNDSFFASHSMAQAALEAAAADLSSAILTSLNSTTDTSSGTSGTASATFNFLRRYTDPTTGNNHTLSSAAVGDEVRIFVGVQPLGDGILGETTPGFFNVGMQGTSASGPAGSQGTAIANAATAGSVNLGRGGGPTMNVITGTLNGHSYSIDAGVALGSSWFDDDTDNDGFADSDTTLNSFWQFDSTAPVAAGKIDFYSVALHEFMHALGIGSSQSWRGNIPIGSNDWTGGEVTAIVGSGDNNIISSDGGHIAETTSVRLSDGHSQQVVMSPSIASGQRKSLTVLDLAFMRDIGWQTVPLDVGLAGDLDDNGVVDSHDIDILWNVIRPEVAGDDDPGANDNEDLNGDGFVNEKDVDYMLANLVNTIVPRPYGDADLDGDVGGIDYTAWRLRAGTGWANGDFDGDGGVGGLDYSLWRLRPTAYPGTVGPHGTANAGSFAAVPEPNSLVLFVLGLVGLHRIPKALHRK